MEEGGNKKSALRLGLKIVGLFLVAVVIIILVTFYILSQSFHSLLTDYTIKLVQVMASQGVQLVESELESGQREASMLAGSYEAGDGGDSASLQALVRRDFLRVVYVSGDGTATSDGRSRDVRHRQDIRTAFQGKTAVYGPYYNEEKEYVVCYSAPVLRDGDVAGVLSIEKDGYLFCEIIKNIRFVNSGESYIINAEGTDIAVSDEEHIEWVTTQYNGQKLLAENPTEEVKSIVDLEQKGLRGEKGIGTYYWNDGLVHVIYEPVPSCGWVLLAGLREEELRDMTQSAMFSAISKGPTLEICLVLLILITGLIIFWIISSMKRTAEINEKLEIIANHDALTGLLNRRFLETSLTELWRYPVKAPSQAAVFMLDIDNFKQYNDFYGHPKGDDCLRRVASAFKHVFDDYNCNVMRYGGEEFIGVVFQVERKDVEELGQKICRQVEEEKIPDSAGGIVTVSVGGCYVNSTLKVSLFDCIKLADKALYQAKESGKNRAVIFYSPEDQI